MKNYDKIIKTLGADKFTKRKPEVPISVKKSEKCRLNAAVISDLHVSQNNADMTENIFHCINDISQAESRIDVLTFAGDLTNNGKEAEYRYLAERLNEVRSVSHILPVSGNHDIRFGSFNRSQRNFHDFCKSVNSSLNVHGLWYSYKVNGFMFIVLGSVKRRFEEATLSKDELLWLDKKLRENDETGLPVFVMLHQPLKKTHNLPYSWDTPGTKAGSVGEQSDMLKFIFGMHDNIFLITGHLHRGYNKYTYQDRWGIHCVNVPSAGLYNKDSDYSKAGIGFMIEVYDDEIVFRPRDFINGRYIPKVEKRYSL